MQPRNDVEIAARFVVLNKTWSCFYYGPIAIFRWDNIDDMNIKDLSVREIQDPPVAAYSSFNTPAIYILTDILVVTVILMIYLAISKFKDYSVFLSVYRIGGC